MKKFLLPIINIINIVLVSITFGLGNNTAVYLKEVAQNRPAGNWYQLVWEIPSVVGYLGFFLFVFGVATILFTLIPSKVRKWVNLLGGAALVAAGVMFLLTPGASYAGSVLGTELSNALIAMAVLVFVAGALALIAALLEIVPLFIKKEAK